MKPNKAYKGEMTIYSKDVKKIWLLSLIRALQSVSSELYTYKDERTPSQLFDLHDKYMTSLAREEELTNVLLFWAFLVNLSRNYKGLYRPVMM